MKNLSLAALRKSSIASMRSYNRMIDRVFYDVNTLTEDDEKKVVNDSSPEGYILRVNPTGKKPSIDSFSPIEFITEQEKKGHPFVDTIIVAGVGSSALGTAALAKNVADHLGRPIAGIVSGYGVADVLSEGLSGWFVYGSMNWMRDSIARVFDSIDYEDHVRDLDTHQDIKDTFEKSGIDKDRLIFCDPDSLTVLYLLLKLGSRIKLLVGHSKGNYSIENAVRAWLDWSDDAAPALESSVSIVTLGAVIHFPEECKKVSQIIGGLDYFGMANSRWDEEHQRIPGAWHSLNPQVPGHLPVDGALDLAEAS